jgi:hypothetical protein
MVGWFVVNVADATARSHERGGVAVTFEDPEDRFPDFAINIRVLEPGQPNGVYHSENVQEDFLLHYPVEELAARFGASVDRPTSNPAEAYEDWSREFTPVDVDWPPPA